MVSLSKNLKHNKEKQLVTCFTSLNSNDKETLLAFAEFLSNRDSFNNVDNNKQIRNQESDQMISLDPKQIDRPETESVINAIKRLTATYPMVEKENLLHTISDLMTTHMMQGKKAEKVIDELESLYFNEYERCR